MSSRWLRLLPRASLGGLFLLLAGSVGWGVPDTLQAQTSDVGVVGGRLLGATRFQLAWLDCDAPRPVFLTALANPSLARDVAALPNTPTALAKIQLGEGDAAVVYSTDVTARVASQFVRIPLPEELQVIATYPIAVANGRNRTGGEAFVDFAQSPSAQEILARWGFINLPPA